jgi:hypothetical protein
MSTRLVLALSFWSALGVSLAHAGDAIVGVVTKVESTTVDIGTGNCERQSVTVSERRSSSNRSTESRACRGLKRFHGGSRTSASTDAP